MAEMRNLVVSVKIRTEPQVKAEALRELADIWYSDEGPWNMHGSEVTWLRERADKLEGGISGEPSA